MSRKAWTLNINPHFLIDFFFGEMIAILETTSHYVIHFIFFKNYLKCIPLNSSNNTTLWHYKTTNFCKVLGEGKKGLNNLLKLLSMPKGTFLLV